MELPLLVEGRILRRYKRFLADVVLEDGRVVTAHCPNTGSMRTCWEPDAPVQLSRSNNPRRKLPWTLERVDMGQGWIGVNTHRVNAVLAEAAREGRLPGYETFTGVVTEVRPPLEELANTRLDLRVSDGRECLWVEIKNTTLLDGEILRFPDAVSERASKHMRALGRLSEAGHRALVLFAINRPEGVKFAPAQQVDPVYAEALRAAVAQGVEVMAVRLLHDGRHLTAGSRVPVDLYEN